MTFSIVICTRNRGELLRSCLESVEALATPPGVTWDVIVCDNDSTDDTRLVVESFQANLPLHYLREDKKGKCYALARIIPEASGEWLLFLDDDVEVEPGWLSAYLDGISRHPEATFFGGQILCSPDTRLTGINAWLVKRSPAIFGVVTSPAECPIDLSSKAFVAGANAAFLRSALLEADVPRRLLDFARNNIVGEDTWLMVDQLHRGDAGWFLTSATVTHHIPPERTGLLWFWNWYVARGRASRRLKPVRGDFDMYEWVAKRRRRMLWNTARQLQFGKVAIIIVSSAAMWIGYLTASRPPQRRRPARAS